MPYEIYALPRANRRTVVMVKRKSPERQEFAEILDGDSAAGWGVLLETTYNGSDADFAVVRLNVDGSLDTTFDGSAANTLGGTVSYTEGGAAVDLASLLGTGASNVTFDSHGKFGKGVKSLRDRAGRQAAFSGPHAVGWDEKSVRSARGSKARGLGQKRGTA